jgi:hypothetical protein
MIQSRILPGILAWLYLASCNTQPTATPSPAATLLAASAHCAHADASGKAVWLDNAADLLAAYADLDKHRLGAPPAAGPEIDFERYGAVAVYMGRKPTAGYALSIDDRQLSIRHKTAELRLAFETPAPGSLTAQVLTSPCVLIGLPRAGYTALRIVDRNGEPRYEIKLNR